MTLPSRAALVVACLTCCEAAPWQIVQARAEPAAVATPSDADAAKSAAAKADMDVRAARLAAAVRPADEAPVRILVDVLARAGRVREALAEADTFAQRGRASAALRAQRGFLRRQVGDLPGAIEDFAAALKGTELAADQRRNVDAGLAEARATQAAAELQGELERAQVALAGGDFGRAAEEARLFLVRHPDSEPAMRIRIDALMRAGQKREALAEIDRLVRLGEVDPAVLAQRGYLRRELNDPHGAAEDFSAALRDRGLPAEQRRNLDVALAEARITEAQAPFDSAASALARRDYNAALEASRAALERTPGSEAAIRVRIEALIRLGRPRDAASEADAFIAHNAASGVLRAQRGYLRRELRDTNGAVEDFNAALAGDGLSDEQRRGVQAALAEARTADRQGDYARAQAALRQGDFNLASRLADSILQADPDSEAGIQLRIDALTRSGRKREAHAEIDRMIARGHAHGWVYAQRGYTRFEASDFSGAARDFDGALARRDLDRPAIANIRYTRAVALATLAERDGKHERAQAIYRELLQADPNQADAWFKLGYMLLKQGQRQQGGDALSKGLAIHPDGPAYLDAANASILSDAPRASMFYRKGLDLWYAGDKSLIDRPAKDLERVRNEVVEADASIRTTLGVGVITARPESAGGNNLAVGAETRVRFDGRYLPEVVGLEAFARGLSGKDANGIRETEAGIGVRYRPIRDLNLYVGGLVDHFFQPNAVDELVLTWGLGLGADAYPYTRGWQPYWDFGTFGTWRTADSRVLEDTRVNAGVLYEMTAPVRAAIGPTVLAVAGYDDKARNPLAGGVGPSVLSAFWLGGDKYRSYDAIVSVQVGYIFNVGTDERQRGWRALIGVTF
jgi:tetratricopeptide (TPR) repeat protein